MLTGCDRESGEGGRNKREPVAAHLSAPLTYWVPECELHISRGFSGSVFSHQLAQPTNALAQTQMQPS